MGDDVRPVESPQQSIRSEITDLLSSGKKVEELEAKGLTDAAAMEARVLAAKWHTYKFGTSPDVGADDLLRTALRNIPAERRDYYRELIRGHLAQIRKVSASSAQPKLPALQADPVEHYRGEFVHDETDLVVQGAGIDFAFQRTYRHQTIFDGPLGHRWDHSYNVLLKVDDVTAHLWTGTGRSEAYRRHAEWGTDGFYYYVPPDGCDATLEPIGVPSAPTGWARRSPDGLRHIFEPDPAWSGGFRLQRIEDRWGNNLAFQYQDGRLTRCLVNNDDRWVQFAYDEFDRIVRVFDFADRTWRYSYDSHGDLVRVTTPPTESQPRGSSTEYRYSSSEFGGLLAHNLTDIYDADGRHYLRTSYGTSPGLPDFNRVVHQRLAHGDFWFTYQPVEPVFAGELAAQDRPVMQCWVKERNGSQTIHTYNEWGSLLRKEETVKAPGRAPLRAIWRHRYNSDGVLIASRTPEGVVTHTLTGRDHFLKVHNIEPQDEHLLWQHEEMTADVRRGFGKILASVRRATLNSGGSVEWNERWGDVYTVDPSDLIVKNTYEPAFGQLLTTSDPRTTTDPDPNADEPDEYDALLTVYEYDGPSEAPTRDLVRIRRPRPHLPDESLADEVVTEILSRDLRGRVTRTKDEIGTETTTEYYPASVVPAERTWEGFVKETTSDEGTGKLNITTRFAIDALGRVVATTLPKGVESADTRFVVTRAYDNLDRITASRRATPLDTESRTKYEPAGKPAVVETDWTQPDEATPPGIDDLGVVKRTYRYNEEHRVIRETWGGSDKRTHFRVAHKYNASGTLRFTLEANDTSVHYRYDSRDQLVRTIRAHGTAGESTSEVVYDLDGRPTVQRTGEGRTTATSYDAFGSAVAVTDPLGNVTRTSYDRGGRPTVVRFFERRPDDTYWLLSRAETVYDELGRPIRSIVNRFNEPLEATNINTDFEASPGPGDALETQTFYDSASRIVRVIDAIGRAHLNEFDAVGRPVAEEDPLENRVEYQYDLHGNVIRKDQRDVVRDSGGAIIGEEVFTWLGTYDERDRLTGETDSLGNVTTHVYDSLDRRVRTTDPLGNVSTVTYDVYGRAASTIERRTATGRGGGTALEPAVVQYEHDRRGNVVARIDALDRRTEFRFDRLNRQIEEIFTDGARVVTRYDRDDFATAVRDANGVVLRNTYDGAGRLIETDVDVSEVDANVTIEGSMLVQRTYDGLGRPTQISNETSTISRTYDSRGGITSESTTVVDSDASPLELERTFDALGNLETLTYPSERALRFERDELDRIKTLVHQGDGTGYPGATSSGDRDLAAFAYRGGRVLSIQRENGVTSARAFDGAGRLIDVHHASTSGTLHRVQQLHDGSRNPRVRIEASETTASPPTPSDAERFGYDSQYQLMRRAGVSPLPSSFFDTSGFAPATSPPSPLVERQSLIDAEIGADITSGTDSWTYDLVGNRTEVVVDGGDPILYEPDARDEYDSVDEVSWVYDASGNLISDGTYKYLYDGWRRLCRVVDASTDAEIVRYLYDGEGRRVIEERAAEAGDPLVIAYDGADRIADYRGSTCVAQYAHGDATDAPLHLATGGGDHWYLFDLQNSVRAVSDAVGGSSAVYEFDSFGDLRTSSGLTLGAPVAGGAQPFGFGGRPYDPTLGLYDQRARVYSPRIGRFLQRDPGGAVDGTNLYSYSGNNPLAYNDPTGRARAALARTFDAAKAWAANPLRAAAQSNGHRSNSFVPNFTPVGLFLAAKENPEAAREIAADVVEVAMYERFEPYKRAIDNPVRAGADYAGPLGTLGGKAWDAWETKEAIEERGVANVAREAACTPNCAKIPYGVAKNAILGIFFGWAAGADFVPTPSTRLPSSGTIRRGTTGSVASPVAPSTPSVPAPPIAVPVQRTVPQLVQDIATRAERAVGGTGGVAGTLKHHYAARMLRIYQRMFRNLGLEVESSYLGGAPARYGQTGSTRLDVYDPTTGIVYDYKFTIRPPALKARQVRKILTHGPAHITNVQEVNP